VITRIVTEEQATADPSTWLPSVAGVMPPESSKQSSTERTPVLPHLVDIQTVAHSFGISMRQVRRFVAEGQIPFVRVGHLIRFDPGQLNDWIDARRAGSVRRP
jgi:excisionase family DNA binding protein